MSEPLVWGNGAAYGGKTMGRTVGTVRFGRVGPM
jgi:hypothetical protein